MTPRVGDPPFSPLHVTAGILQLIVKFLLVNPAAEQWRIRPGQKPPLATRVFRFSMLTSLAVAASAPEGVDVQIVDEEVEPIDFDTDADVVGISSMTFNAPRAYEIADRFRREKGRPVILGGYHPTFLPEEALGHADAVCAGEAETSMARMLEDARTGRLRGVYAGRPADLSKLRPVNRGLAPGGRYAWVSALQAWYSQCSVTLASDDELLRLAVRSGCRGLFVGFESISEGSLQSWGKTFARARDYSNAVKKLHGAGIAVYAGIVFGGDADGPDIFDRTLTFLREAGVDVLQATILTPFPGTPLFAAMEREGRIVDRDWSHYDFRHVVFEPAGMSRAELQAGHDSVLTRFYSLPRVLLRLQCQVSSLSLSTLLLGVAPLNFGYRSRLRRDGTWCKAASGRPG